MDIDGDRARRRLVRSLLACLLAAACAWTGLHAQSKAQFGAKAELVLVDVSVTDNNSQPITDLSAADFELEVNGQPRAIASIQYISTLPETPAEPSDLQAPSSNEAPTSGRLMLFVVDDGHIRVGGAQAIIRTGEMLLDQLAPGDMVGLARLPSGIGSVEFTADRQRIREALRRPAGTPEGMTGSRQVQISEAFALETNDMDTWQQAVARECAGQSDLALDSCADMLEVDARNALNEASARATQTLRYLDTIFTRLARLDSPVNVIMISEGLFLGRSPVRLADVSRRAAEARVTLHIVRPAQSMMADASRATSGGARSFSLDDYLMRDGLEQLAGQTRGRLLQVAAGTGRGIFERLNRELSGYYLLGFEPTDADRTGRQRRIRVEVRRRGVTVRARPTFAVARESALAADAGGGAAVEREPEAVVKDLLSEPLPDRGLPMRVTTYNVVDGKDSRVRVIVSAEIGEPAREPAEFPIGILVLDKNDKQAAGSVSRMILSPASPRAETPRLLQTTVLLDPGEYTLRIAAIDDNGRTGSVHHVVRAQLARTAGRQEVSDLLVTAEPLPPDGVRIAPAPLVDTEGASFQISIAGQNNAQLANTAVTLQVAESAQGPPLTSVELPLALRDGALRTFGGVIRLGLLPPGQYVARALISSPGQPETRVTRAFRFAPVTTLPPITANDTAPEPARSVDEEVPPPPPPRIAVRIPRFDAATVLEPKVVGAFLDSLEFMYPPSPEAAAILARAREGHYEAPEPRSDASPGDGASFAFVRGLGELKKQRYAQAQAWFQVALKSASDYLGSAFYIGACHAANGRDTEAVGAWQMSLLSDAADVIYPPLVDGFLRLGDGLQALAFLDEAPGAWTDLDARDERQATAEAMTGAYSPALEKLHVLIEKRPADLDLLYLALQVMYRMRQETGVLNDADSVRFADYAKRYADGKGPQAALVATWQKFMTRR